MEPIGAFVDEEWESVSRILSTVEADNLMTQYHAGNNEYGNIFSINEANLIINGVHESSNSVHFSDFVVNNNFQHHFSQENSNSSGSNSPFFPTPSFDTHFFSDDSTQIQVTNNNNIHDQCMNIYSNEFLVPHFPDNVMEDFLCMNGGIILNEKLGNEDNSTKQKNGEELKLKRKIDLQEEEEAEETCGEEKNNDLPKSPKKQPRLRRDAQKGKKNAVSKKSKKLTLNRSIDEEESNAAGTNAQSPSCCSSDDDDSQNSKGVNAALNSNGKTRASRGAATDPQSLYARRRRERINERLRILQNLVPNGTKVDISTMLEEAVHYVKFLQLQIKLLSSDDLWMFAPIAYNGMDMGLYHKLSL